MINPTQVTPWVLPTQRQRPLFPSSAGTSRSRKFSVLGVYGEAYNGITIRTPRKPIRSLGLRSYHVSSEYSRGYRRSRRAYGESN